MPVKISGSYVSEAAYSFAQAQVKDKEENNGIMKSLAEKFPNLKFRVGTKPFSSPDKKFNNTNELTNYLRENFNIVGAGMAKISGKFLQKCLTDEESRQKLFDNLRAAEDSYASRKDEVGFQGMQVIIDEDGEMTMESSKRTVSINEDKRRRQIAAAATQGDICRQYWLFCSRTCRNSKMDTSKMPLMLLKWRRPRNSSNKQNSKWAGCLTERLQWLRQVP